jgi:hypothetical protein
MANTINTIEAWETMVSETEQRIEKIESGEITITNKDGSNGAADQIDYLQRAIDKLQLAIMHQRLYGPIQPPGEFQREVKR